MVPLVNVNLVKVSIESFERISNTPLKLEAFGINQQLFEQKSYYFPAKPFNVFLSFVHHTLDDFQLIRFYENLVRHYSIPIYIERSRYAPKDLHESLRLMIELTKSEAPSANIRLVIEREHFWITRTKVVPNIADDTPSNLSFLLFIKIWINTILRGSYKALEIKSASPTIQNLGCFLVDDDNVDISSQDEITAIAYSIELLGLPVKIPEDRFGIKTNETVEINFIDSIKCAMDSFIGSDRYNIESIADSLGVSVRKFQYSLKEHGLTFKVLKDELVLENSNSLIKQNKLSLSEIATQLGFSSMAQYSRSLKRITGLPPREYKKLLLSPVNLKMPI